MTLKQVVAPAGANEALDKALESRFPGVVMRGRAAGLVNTPLEPVPCFHLGLDALGDQAPLEHAVQTGWRFVVEPDARTALAKLSNESDGTPPRFQGLAHGLLVQRFQQALAFAQQYLGPVQDEYEPRLLDVPAVDYMALWLKGAQDKFIALLDGVPPGSAALSIIDDALPELQYRARKRAIHAVTRGITQTPTN